MSAPDRPASQHIDRPARYMSHAIVEVRRFKHLPVFAHSAVLLDISVKGFKLEFTGETHSQPGKKHWLKIPLAPLGIPAPAQLTLRAECKWFDSQRYRIGGIFLGLSDTDTQLLELVIDRLGQKSLI